MVEPPDPGRIDPERQALLAALTEKGVALILIGGAAIQSHGRRYDTLDVDVAPDREPENLERLAEVLNELECRLVTDPAEATAWVALPDDYFTARTPLQASTWNLATKHGLIDLTFAPSGFPGGYRDLAPRATSRVAASTTIVVSVASLDDVHESKRQADRPKDREYLRDATR